ncbi:MAG: Dabb family protein, partial [Alphaproteobacteria bacterium]|nr:Dabb family protein [Alphaproteobacteria bacterium]
MIRHVVLFKLRSGLPPETADNIFTALKALQSQIPGIIAISTGADVSPEGLQRGNSHGFTVDFVDAAARDIYLPHPKHQKVGAMIVASSEGGVDGI